METRHSREEALVQMESRPTLFDFAPVENRRVVAGCDGGAITSNAGALLLGATDRAIGLVRRFAACFRDRRAPERVEHEMATLVGQRVFGIALGHEDLIDHDQLRHDPALAVLAGKLEARRAGCAPLAGKSTLNRLEHAPAGAPGRYQRICHDAAAIEALFVDLFLDAHRSAPRQIILDVDATDIPLHGHQEGRFFHGCYDAHCYLPLYAFCGRHLLAARLRPSNIDAAAGAGGGGRAHRPPDPRALAQGPHPAARRRRLRPRGADGLVRGEPLGLRVRPRPQRPPGRGTRHRPRLGRRGGNPNRSAGPPGASATSAGRRWTAGRAGDA
jgi:hypothetical protein